MSSTAPVRSRPPTALTIAGTDPSGGAGIQADLKTFHELDVYGMSVVAALTAQNTRGVQGTHDLPAAFVTAQLDAVASDIRVDAAKTGMLSTTEAVVAVADGVRRHGIARLVVDPVCASKHGDPLLRPEAVEALRTVLVPLAEVVTPNLGEVEALAGVRVEHVRDLPRAAEAMLALGPRWVLVKGGHLPGSDRAVDLLSDGERTFEIAADRLGQRNTHGTGCTLAAAIAASRARGEDVVEAVRSAKRFVTGAIRGGLAIGGGIGPVDHAWPRHEPGPAALRAGVGAVVRDAGGRILLHRRRDGGGWAPPSGGIEPGETVVAALLRELGEETGLDVEVGRLVGVYSDPAFQTVERRGGRVQYVTEVFECAWRGGELSGSEEGIEWAWFPPDGLPAGTLPYAEVWVRDARVNRDHVVVR